jgi:fructokinase
VARVVGLGELLWDLFPDGKVLGGAPANFAFHAAALGHDAHVASRVGRDDLGREMLAALAQRGLGTRCIQIDRDHPTGTVPVRVGPDGAPTFSIVPNVAWDYLDDEPALYDLMARADLVGVGTLAQRSEQSARTIQRLLGACSAPVLFDANLRHRLWSAEVIAANLDHTTILKVDRREWDRLVELGLAPHGAPPIEACRTLIERHHLAWVCITRGADGCLLVSADDAVEHPGFAVTVVDTVGCGDAFAAAVADGWLAQRSLSEIAHRANRLGAWVAAHRGATVDHPDSESPWRATAR